MTNENDDLKFCSDIKPLVVEDNSRSNLDFSSIGSAQGVTKLERAIKNAENMGMRIKNGKSPKSTD